MRRLAAETMQRARATAPSRARCLPPWAVPQLAAGAAFVAGDGDGHPRRWRAQYRAQAAGIRESRWVLLLNIARTARFWLIPRSTARSSCMVHRRFRRASRYLRLDAGGDPGCQPGPGDPDLHPATTEPPAHRAASSSPAEAPGCPGEPYSLVPDLIPALERAFGQGVPTATPIYRNQSGAWLTAFAPIKGADGQTLAVLEVDYKADVYLTQLATARRRLLWHLLAGGALAAVAGVLVALGSPGPVAQRPEWRGAWWRRPDCPGHGARRGGDVLGNVFHLMVQRLPCRIAA